VRRPGAAGALVLLAGLTLAACGGGGKDDTTATTARATLTEPATLPRTVETATVPTATVTHPATTATTAAKKPTATSPESQPGGAGDETGIRVPATFIISGGRLTPRSIGVPAFLRIAFGVVNRDARAHRVAFRGHTLAVPAHGSASVTVTGPKRGRYAVTLDGRKRALIITGAQVGP
jgi:hypothetical protein